MIELLKSEVQTKLGIEVKRRGDCQLLSDAISLELGETLNYNTLRRFFSIDKKANVTPSRNTLDLLSAFLGYKSYNQFTKQVVRFGANQYHDEWYSILNKTDTDGIINYLLEKRGHSSFTDLFIRSVRELLLMRRIDDVDSVFNCDELGMEKFSYSQSVYIGNAIGILMRDVQLCEKEYMTLLLNKNFAQSVFSIFVDYSGLNSEYGKIIELAQKCHTLSSEDRAFFICLDYLRAFLTGQRTENSFDLDIATFDGHPILVGRIASVHILRCEQNDPARINIFNELTKRFSNEKVKRIDYFYEVNITALILSDFALMEVLEMVQSGPHIKQQYQISHNQLHYIVNLLLAISNDNQDKVEKLLDEIKPELWVNSYYDLFDLFYQIVLFHSTDDSKKKKKSKAQYLSITNRMNYKKFDEAYLDNYFNQKL